MLKYRLWQIKRNIKNTVRSDINSRKVSIAVEQRSTNIINLVGYVILFLVLLDYSFLLVSSQIFDPEWAYNTSGKLVENVWGILLGYLLVFYRREQDTIKPLEFRFLSWLSWLVLLIGLGYFLITPVIVGNAYRIHNSGLAQVRSQIDLQKTQIEQYSQQLESSTPQQLQAFLQAQARDPELKVDSVDNLKSSILKAIEEKQVTAEKQLLTQFGLQTKGLLKNTIRWAIGAIVSGICLVLIWRHTQWTRARY